MPIDVPGNTTLIGQIVLNLNTLTAQPIQMTAARYLLTGYLLESVTGDPQLATGSLFADSGGVTNLLTQVDSLYFPATFPTTSSCYLASAGDYSATVRANVQTLATIYAIMGVAEGSAQTANLWIYGMKL
jgi:hypothetical protein